MKTTIKIKNFRSLEDVEIELAPTTILVGPNGAGKSSFQKALGFLGKNIKEINLKKSNRTIFSWYNFESEIDLGSFPEIVSNNEVDKEISFELNHISGIVDGIYPPWFTLDDEAISKFKTLSLGNQIIKSDESIRKATKCWTDEKLLELFSDRYKNLLYGLYHSTEEQVELLKLFQSRFNFTLKVTFSQNIKGKCLKHLELTDNESRAVLSYLQDVRKKGSICGRYSIDFQNEFLNHLLTRVSIKKAFWSYDSKHYAVTADFVEALLKKYNKWYNKQKSKGELNIAKKEEVVIGGIAKILSLFYFFPSIAGKFLNIEHMPSVREIPKREIKLPVKKEGEKSSAIPTVSHFMISNIIMHKDEYQIIDDLLENPPDIDYSKLPEEYRRFDPDYLRFVGRYSEKVKITYLNEYLQEYDYNKYLLETIRRLGLCKGVYVKESEKYYEQRVITFSGAEINMCEASSGMLQLFPIITTIGFWLELGLITQYGQVLSIEQPELHLHPKLQKELVELFRTSDTHPYNNLRYIIETHSEHFIRAYQIAIAKGEIKTSNIKFYYFLQDGQSTKVKELIIDDNGNFLSEWPNGFFSESSDLSFQLLEAQIKRNE